MKLKDGPPGTETKQHHTLVRDLFGSSHLQDKEATMTARPKPRIAAVTPISDAVAPDGIQNGHIKVEIIYDEVGGRDRVRIEVETEPPERPYLPNILREMAAIDIYPVDKERRLEAHKRKVWSNRIITLSAAVVTAIVLIVLVAVFMVPVG
jgi:hypothetical protein